jgi:hypothetical protein
MSPAEQAEYDSRPSCTACEGRGEVFVTGMMSTESVPCWMCRGKGVLIDATVHGQEIRESIATATAFATERDRPKTRGDRLAFAIQHATDGVCP